MHVPIIGTFFLAEPGDSTSEQAQAKQKFGWIVVRDSKIYRITNGDVPNDASALLHPIFIEQTHLRQPPTYTFRLTGWKLVSGSLNDHDQQAIVNELTPQLPITSS